MRLSWGRADSSFYDLFERAAGNAARAATLLRDLIAQHPERQDLAREIFLCEQEGDRITHDIIYRLNSGARPPFARDQVHAFATAFDDIVDLTEQVADSFALYRIEASMDQAQALVEVLVASCDAIASAVKALRGKEGLAEHLVEVHRLENEGDRISRDAIAALFDGGIDPMVVIRWKDIFEQLESAIDACETVAHMVESIALVEV